MKNLTAVFYVDALNSSFVNSDTMPFLSSLATHSYCELENVLGYSFAIQSCMLSGKYPDETNHWLPYFYSPEESPSIFKALKELSAVFPVDRLPPLRYLAMDQIRRFFLRHGVRISNAPLRIVDKITLYPYYYMGELPFFSELKELLDRKYCTSLTYIGPPKVRRHLFDVLIKHVEASNNESECIIAYDDALDGLGHKFGPYSAQCINYAKSLDRVLLRTQQKLERHLGKDLTLIIFSDHGQYERTQVVDLLSELEKNALHLSYDYFCFIDATLALFWPNNRVAKERILNVLGKIKTGRVIDEDLQKKYHLRFNDERYGEIIFLLKPGGTFFPNFFSPLGAMKGLHGYSPDDDVQKGFLISSKRLVNSPKHVKDFRNLVMDISGING